MKSNGISFLLWLLCLVGFCGIHRFYNGKWVTGLLWFFTGGLFLIGQIIDLFLINSMTREANRRIHEDIQYMQRPVSA
jgi:TM2 domain-containing membrane protein YozV